MCMQIAHAITRRQSEFVDILNLAILINFAGPLACYKLGDPNRNSTSIGEFLNFYLETGNTEKDVLDSPFKYEHIVSQIGGLYVRFLHPDTPVEVIDNFVEIDDWCRNYNDKSNNAVRAYESCPIKVEIELGDSNVFVETLDFQLHMGTQLHDSTSNLPSSLPTQCDCALI